MHCGRCTMPQRLAKTSLTSLPLQLSGAPPRARRRNHATLTPQAQAEASAPRTALVTGGNTGIGFITARELAAKGFQVVLACRNEDKARAAQAKIRGLVPGAKVEVGILDLADQASVKDFAKRALDAGAPLDVLVNNAGVMATPQMSTVDGFEYQLGVNHLGHYTLTNLLLPLLTGPGRSSRIINVSSVAHQFGNMEFDDLQSARGYQPWKAYGQSKLANLLFTYELARRLPLAANTTVNALHPGIVNTELSRYLLPENPSWWQTKLLSLGARFAKTPDQGAETSIYLASSPEVEGISSKYYDNCKPISSNAVSYDPDVARRLWEASAELTGVDA